MNLTSCECDVYNNNDAYNKLQKFWCSPSHCARLQIIQELYKHKSVQHNLFYLCRHCESNKISCVGLTCVCTALV
jgi:hypothetical protein